MSLGNGQHRQPIRQAAHSAADLWGHVLHLIELQWQLLFAETRDGVRDAKFAALLLLLGGLLAVMAVPLLLFALTYFLVEAEVFSVPVAFVVVAALTGIVAAALLIAARQRLRHSSLKMPHTREQAQLNWAWIKQTVRSGGPIHNSNLNSSPAHETLQEEIPLP